MARKVLPLKGYKALNAFYAFNALVLGLKMLPEHLGKDYDSFLDELKARDDAGREDALRKAAAFVQLQQDEVEALVCFCTDPNGVPYTSVNVGNLGIQELQDIIVAVCLEISRIDIKLVSEDEKKKSGTEPSISDGPT